LGVSELISGWLTNRIGRKHMLIVGVIVNVIGIIVLQTAQNWKIWLVGKMINAVGFGTMYVVNPIW
jgi:MFS family permease